MSSGGGGTDSDSSSRVLTAAEREKLTMGAVNTLGSILPGMTNTTTTLNGTKPVTTSTFNAPQYQAPEYAGTTYATAQPAVLADPLTSNIRKAGAVVDSGITRSRGGGTSTDTIDPGEAARLSDGDYNALQQSLLRAQTIPLEYALRQAQSDVNQDAANRGIYSSGLAMRSQNDLADRFAPQLRTAAESAAAQRYALQQGDNTSANNFNISRAGLMNTNNLGRDTMLNNFSLGSARNDNDASLARDAMLNDYNLNSTNSLNQTQLARDAMLNDYNIKGAGMLNDYNLQATKMMNEGSQFDAAQLNSFNMENANRANTAAWAPANYLKDLWNGTGGTISQGESSGRNWNFSI